jgi:hypothetical protein
MPERNTDRIDELRRERRRAESKMCGVIDERNRYQRREIPEFCERWSNNKRLLALATQLEEEMARGTRSFEAALAQRLEGIKEEEARLTREDEENARQAAQDADNGNRAGGWR